MSKAQEDLEKGIKLFNEGKYQDAISILEQAETQASQNKNFEVQTDIQFWLGRCYYKLALKAGNSKKTEELFNQAIDAFKKSLNLAKQIADEQQNIEAQNNTQYWLGFCYLEQALETENDERASPLFELAIGSLQDSLDSAQQLADKQQSIQVQNNAQHWLGLCYYAQALKAKKSEKTEKLLKAIKALQASIHLATQITDEQQSIQAQYNTQYGLGFCYLEQALEAKNNEQADLFEQATGSFKNSLNSALKIADEQQKIQAKNNSQHWLGRCYYEQALKTEDSENASSLFKQAIDSFEEELKSTQQIANKQQSIQAQNNAQYWLGHCYLEQTLNAENNEQAELLFNQAIAAFQASFEFAQQITDEQKSIQEQNNVQYWLGYCYYQKALKNKDFKTYLAYKKDRIKNEIHYLDLNHDEKDYISDILSVLLIYPYEIENKAIGHYTSPKVVELLLGIVTKVKDEDKDKSPMRLNLATYMNDILEGKALLNYLLVNHTAQKTEREEIKSRAFFTCFSSRVDDLNQFRLYGKVDDVEASGCCLVFNKNKSWLKNTNVVDSFNIDKDNKNLNVSLAEQKTIDLPLYQVAYLDLNKNDVFLPKVSDQTFDRVRHKNLKEALNKLKDQAQSPILLEYLRYLFKDIAFKDEEEFRILRLKELTDEEVKHCPYQNTLYLEYKDISEDIDEIILGTNFEYATDSKEGTEIKRRKDVFAYQVKKQNPKIKVFQSHLPINKPA